MGIEYLDELARVIGDRTLDQLRRDLEGKVSERELLDRIFEVRRANNIPWRRLMELALQHAPEEAKDAIREIADNDLVVAATLNRLSNE